MPLPRKSVYSIHRLAVLLRKTVLIPRSVTPVSYTHIDVYKRQVCENQCQTGNLACKGVDFAGDEVAYEMLVHLRNRPGLRKNLLEPPQGRSQEDACSREWLVDAQSGRCNSFR